MASLINSAGATGSGSMTLAGPNTNSTQTITIPDTTGTMMVSAAMPAFSAYLDTANQSITPSTWTKVALNAKEFDTASAFNTTSGIFQPATAGYYQISGAINLSATSNTQVVGSCSIYKNGAFYKQGSTYATNSSVSNNMTCTVTAIIYLNGSTDTLELWGYNAGTSTIFTAGSTSTYFSGVLVRAA